MTNIEELLKRASEIAVKVGLAATLSALCAWPAT